MRSTDSSKPSGAILNCPNCSNKGRAVKPITLESLLTSDAQAGASNLDGFRFCATAGCDVVYYKPETGEVYAATEVTVPIGQKQTDASRTVCYCFAHTAAEIEADVAMTGDSSIPGDIAVKCKSGLDRCPETNPQGAV